MRLAWLLPLFILGSGCGLVADSASGRAPTNQSGDGPAAGTMTAGDWDDGQNFDAFVELFAEAAAASPELDSFDAESRVLLEVQDESGAPVPAARVRVNGGPERITGSDGRLALFPSADGIKAGVPVEVRSGSAMVTVQAETPTLSVTLPGAETARPTAIDLALVLDVTGSMGDELEYLVAEIEGIVRSVSVQDLRLALVVFRDEGDDFVVQSHGFSDLARFSSALARYSASGGGDYPEASHAGLEAALQLGWRTGPEVTRVLFLIGDAPPHRKHLGAFLRSGLGLRSAGVRVFPVAASGVDALAELAKRVLALTTAARYIFLTDDSGIGNPHAEPSIPCYRVQRLADLMARAIRSQVEGRWMTPDPADVLRVEGPVEGEGCVTEDGRTWRL